MGEQMTTEKSLYTEGVNLIEDVSVRTSEVERLLVKVEISI